MESVFNQKGQKKKTKPTKIEEQERIQIPNHELSILFLFFGRRRPGGVFTEIN